jgi:flagellar basal-body rod modification protein FlgD
VPWLAGKDKDNPDTYRFRVTASNGSTPLASTALVRDRVDAVNTGGSSLTVELERLGRVPYSQITALD